MLVSLDALFVGMSLKLQKGFKLAYDFLIPSILLALSLIAYYVAGALSDLINFDTSWLVGGAFLILGVRNLFSKDEKSTILTTGTVIVLSLVMSIDSVITTVLLTIENGDTVLIPILVSLGHFIFLITGSYVVKFMKIPLKIRNIISASCLFLVAILNFTGVM